VESEEVAIVEKSSYPCRRFAVALESEVWPPFNIQDTTWAAEAERPYEDRHSRKGRYGISTADRPHSDRRRAGCLAR